ncbi:hypothetical protein FRB93_013572 [Tulasnella sp. JGI-2019a]|nr:hypothetical protein FRB93_013572 [Tulasnella sp. JGI-2019a]
MAVKTASTDDFANQSNPSIASHHPDSPLPPPYTQLPSDSSPHLDTLVNITSNQPEFTAGSISRQIGLSADTVSETPPSHPVDTADTTTAMGASQDAQRQHEDKGHRNTDRADCCQDLLPKIKGLFRLLDLYSEQSSGGLVDKILIAQDSLKSLIDTLSPGAYTSITKIDFAALDHVHIRAIGLYGSKSEIVRLLQGADAVDKETANLLLLLDHDRKAFQLSLRSGIYLFLPPAGKLDLDHGRVPTVYVIYWPEDTTWDDAAGGGVKRNRVTFMRYLTRLTDQIRILVSPEHATSIIWGDEDLEKDCEGDKSSADCSDSGDEGDDRVFKFEVAKIHEQENDAHVHPGFIFKHQAIGSPAGPESPGECPPILVAGETRQGFMTVSTIPRRIDRQNIEGDFSGVHLASMLKDRRVYMDPSIDENALTILMTDGRLSSRVPKLYKAHVKNMGQITRANTAESLKQIQIESNKIGSDRGLLKEGLKRKIALVLHKSYPMFNLARTDSADQARTIAADEGYTHLANICAVSSEVSKLCDTIFPEMDVNRITAQHYKNLKRRFLFAQTVLEKRGNKLDDNQRASLISRILSLNNPLVTSNTGGGKGLFKSFLSMLKGDSAEKLEKDIQQLFKARLSEPDPEFLRSIQEVETMDPSLSVTARELLTLAREWAEEKINHLSSSSLPKVESAQLSGIEKRIQLGLQPQETAKRMPELLKFRDHLNTLFVPKGLIPDLTLSEVRESPDLRGYFRVVGYSTTLVKPVIGYHIWPMELTEPDNVALRNHPLHIPNPRARPHSVDFTLPEGHHLRHVQLLRSNRYLVIADSPEGTRIWLQSESKPFLPTPTKQLRLPRQYAVAVDEIKRLVSFVCTDNGRCTLNIFVMDEELTHLSARGSPCDVTKWYTDGPAQIRSAVFFPGTEELCLIEQSGRARIYSFLALGFRPASIQLPPSVELAQSAPDASALLVVENTSEGTKRIRVFHRASFGNGNTADGIVQYLPIHFSLATHFTITSLGQRNITLLALLPRTSEIGSVTVEISRQETEFNFQAKSERDQSSTMVATKHNSLLNCFSEVWSRFPVVSAIKRETILADGRLKASVTFVTDQPAPQFTHYFKGMIQGFKKLSRKPTEGRLDSIKLESLSFNDVDWDHGSGSVFWTGEWLVELLCLIPIHIAVARENHFIPLKDGVFDLRLQQQLLGAEVFKIIDTLSIGWYESIFSSYHATKEVKVISSMGEQSVGKSYSLNHIVDSSFAGSAVRTTEGVWLSVCPLKHTLVVALDFEGVHSIERTAQEDMLLVLFNTALSNLIIFRNNFALSREVANMFTSFQASTRIFHPEANPRLFQGCLVVAIKDVVDGDKHEIVQEFSMKFKQIVEKEKANNFITKLHADQLHVMPWSVIESREFYTLFSKIKRQLFSQKTTHASAGEFLMTLKTLMAKLKAQDWGAMDQTLVKHRCAFLLARLPTALAIGYAEADPVIELKNLDNQETVPSSDSSSAMFYLGKLPKERQDSFRKLFISWRTEPARNDVTELKQHIQTMVQARVTHVKSWMDANTSRFQADNPDILAMKREYKDLSEYLKANTQPCLMKCSSCQLPCLLIKSHESQEHDCNTNHICLERCEFLDDHNELSEDDDSCSLPAGHGGCHICGGTEHVCGQPCYLNGRKGCQQRCTKAIGHENDGHACSARVHQCGEPCGLRDVPTSLGVLYTCSGFCTRPFDEDHDQHSCDDLMSCPIQCELCQRLCTLGNHFHGLDGSATPTHLCGQEHSCKYDCEIPGFCEVVTTPQAVEALFVGQHESFQFTKYTQVAKRHACAATIAPGERNHSGPHVHSTANNPFHYCKVACPNCGYICQLPYEHKQENHRTAHGSMEKTSWAIEGAEDVFVEVQGRKYAARDGGGPQLCSSVCSKLGRHTHIDYCHNTPENCREPESEHITVPMLPEPTRAKDWVSHKAFWARSGFEDPYSQDDQTEFAKCDAQCAGPEHEATGDYPARPSYCALPIFHSPQPLNGAGNNASYISTDGHFFPCPHPDSFRPAFHIIFILDRSGSMANTDRQPITNTPGTASIMRCNSNRFGAVLSAVYGFWNSRSSGVAGCRRDSYSVILFNSSPETLISNDFTSTPDQLLNRIVSIQPAGGTNFNGALKSAQSLMEAHWSTDRSPVVIFLSDGESSLDETVVYGICRGAAARQKSLSLHAVSFASSTSSPQPYTMSSHNTMHTLFQPFTMSSRGTRGGYPRSSTTSSRRARDGSLQRMATIAEEVVQAAPKDPLSPLIECSYTDAMNTIRLAETFLNISGSLKKSRAALIPTND